MEKNILIFIWHLTILTDLNIARITLHINYIEVKNVHFNHQKSI